MPSPSWIIYYSRAMTQVVTSLLIVWSLYFLLGEDRKQSQLIIGAILAALVVMVRQNLLPLFVFTLLYISVGKRFEEEQHSNFNWISSFHRLQCDLLARDLFLYMETLFPGIC
jgi:uncharacterized BrkB/YihY/UPF0761 family membrane protein